MKKHSLPTYLFVSLLAVVVAGSISSIVLAQTTVTNPGNSTGVTNPGNSTGVNNPGNSTDVTNKGSQVFYLQNPLNSKFNTVGGIINGFLDIFTYLVILFAVLMIIYVGLRFVLAQGNVEELKERKNQLLWLLVGVAIVIGARVLISAVVNTLQTARVVSPGVFNGAQNAIRGQ